MASTKSQSFRSQAVSPLLPLQAWKALQRPETWGTIGGVRRVEHPTFDDGGNLTGYRFVVAIAGTEHDGTATRSSMVTGEHMVMKVESPQLIGQIEVALSPAGEGTSLSVSMTMSPKGFIASMMFGVIAKAVTEGFDETVARFVSGLD